MKYFFLFIVTVFASQLLSAQELTGKELLEKAINYHDPDHNWSTFKGELFVTMETPNNASRESKIIINLPSEYFYIQTKRDTVTTEYTL